MTTTSLLSCFPTEMRYHSYRVSILVSYYTDTNDICFCNKLRDTALLHDMLEDTEFKEEDIEDADVREAVVILTRKSDETYFDYIQRIIDSKNRYAYFVKIADISDHLIQIETLKPSLKPRYEKALSMLRSAEYFNKKGGTK